MNIRTLIFILSILSTISAVHVPLSARAPLQPEDTRCTLTPSTDMTKGKPLVYGDPFRVPSLQLRFVKKLTGTPLTPRAVHIHYLWKWLEYPYPEHEWGAWVDGQELVNCTPLGLNTLLVPELLVRPRGWYDGKYVRFPWPRKPRFDRLEIIIEQEPGYSPDLIIHREELKRFHGRIATVELSSGAPSLKFDHN